MPIISGTAMWASLEQPNTKFEHKWCVDVCNLSDEDVAKLTEQGLGGSIKEDAEGDKGTWIQINQKVHGKNGNMFEPPVVVDKNLRPFHGSIGNGSKINVKYKVREWDYNGKKGVSADLQKVQVVDLVEYEGGDGEDFEAIGDDDGGEDFGKLD